MSFIPFWYRADDEFSWLNAESKSIKRYPEIKYTIWLRSGWKAVSMLKPFFSNRFNLGYNVLFTILYRYLIEYNTLYYYMFGVVPFSLIKGIPLY